ncbi:hypothetical protein PAMC26510_15550 [Caballeronia sordidicola]|uniref:Uncharacterized protein n=1 Tax=Caballeronia sordidicola TaxID=196367 RepID=A0A242MU68_CABSO|nr:hypothetical protein PAMC26510_15550 [Caballeronia sordidicola]
MASSAALCASATLENVAALKLKQNDRTNCGAQIPMIFSMCQFMKRIVGRSVQ